MDTVYVLAYERDARGRNLASGCKFVPAGCKFAHGYKKKHMNTALSCAIELRTSQARFTTITRQLLHNRRTMSFLNECMADNDRCQLSLAADQTSEACVLY